MPDEIQAGLARSASVKEMEAVLERHLPQVRHSHEAAEVLRQRIANGRRTIADARAGLIEGLSGDAIPAAEALMTTLEQELRGHEFWLTAGLGLAMAWGIGEVIQEAGLEEGWKPPPGSVLRLVLPGLVNVAVDLTS